MKKNEELSRFIKTAIQEDIGEGDHSTLACIPENKKGKAQLLVKEDGVISGISIAKSIFKEINPSIQFKNFLDDGEPVKKGDIAFHIEGNLHAILMGERLVLNIMQRMSGIATSTKLFTDKVSDLPVAILDTRKTIPGMRFLEKLAVKTGGGENHRMGLYDMIMLKDNHIDYSGGIQQAIKNTKQYLQRNKLSLKIVIEARTIECVKEILSSGGIDRILLDNMSPEQIKEAVQIINKEVKTEASGNISLENVREYAETGVDYISVGSITHQARSIDLSLKAINE